MSLREIVEAIFVVLIVMLIEIFIPIFVGERPTFGETGGGAFLHR